MHYGNLSGQEKRQSGGAAAEYGIVKVLHATVERIGHIEIINQVAPKRNRLPVGEPVFIVAAKMLLDPRPKYTIPECYQKI